MSYMAPQGDFSIPMTSPANQVNMRAIMRLVYVWMGLGLLTSALVAWFTANNESMLALAVQLMQGSTYILTFFLLFGFVIAISAGINSRKLSPSIALLLFFVYAAVIGFLLSIIFIAFDMSDIIPAYGTTVILFGVMSIFGFTTNMDLTKWGTYLMMGFVAFAAILFVNVAFLGSGESVLLSIFGVFIFTGLTAYDTQKIKQYAESSDIQTNSNDALSFSIYGALILYIDFVNLFLRLLNIFGSRD